MESSRPPEQAPQGDDLYVRLAIAEAKKYEQVIADPVARCIASQWYDGQDSATYSFVSTGRIDIIGIAPELTHAYHHASDSQKEALDALGKYLLHHADEVGQREPVERWNDVARWDNGDLERNVMNSLGHVSTKRLIERIEQAEPFSSDDEEFELNRRLRLVGKTWRWVTIDGRERVEMYELEGES